MMGIERLMIVLVVYFVMWREIKSEDEEARASIFNVLIPL